MTVWFGWFYFFGQECLNRIIFQKQISMRIGKVNILSNNKNIQFTLNMLGLIVWKVLVTIVTRKDIRLCTHV